MDLRRLEFDDNLLRAMYNLRLQIEIAEHRNISPTQSVEDLAELMACASVSHHPLVKSAYLKFTRLLDPSLFSVYESMGLPIQIAR